MPTESLTLRITGDSAPLHRELDAVERRLEAFASHLARAADVGRVVDQSVGRLTETIRPLEQVSRLLERITSQLRALGQIPVQLNVAPAMNALGTLSRQIDQLAAKLAALALPRPNLPAPVPPPIPFRRFAEGGLVAGPAGLDRIPALLSAGEFVLRESSARQLGLDLLQQLNRPAPAPLPAPATTLSSPAAITNASSSVTNVGGIAIHVARPTDLGTVLNELRFQDFRLRNRRG